MTTNTEIKTWQDRTPNNLTADGYLNAAKEEIAELRAALASTAAELEEWRFTNRIDELQRENDRLRASQQGAGELPKLRDITQLVHDAGVMAPNESHYSVAITALAQRAASVPDDDMLTIAYLAGQSKSAASVPAEAVQPVGYVYGNSYWEEGNPRLTDQVRRFSSPRFTAPVPAASMQASHKEAHVLLKLCYTFDITVSEGSTPEMAIACRLKDLQDANAAAVPQDIGRDAALDKAGVK